MIEKKTEKQINMLDEFLYYETIPEEHKKTIRQLIEDLKLNNRREG
jgi:hypothetical protein